MSHRNTSKNASKVSKSSPGGKRDATPSTVQEKLSARQAKRSAKAAERRDRSEALREEGNTFFRNGDYQNAVDRYQQAIRVHGGSVKPILLTNLAAAYLNLGKFPEANEAAEKALEGDPKSVKARYRRGMARKNMEMWRAAAIDFCIVLKLDPRYQEVKKELAYVEKCRRQNWLLEEDGIDWDSEYELPGPDDEPDLGESLSESSDCEHTGNGKPCKFYNHTECIKGRACYFSHAPDYQSERDALGRNVCRYYLMGLCRFGERCSYLHSQEFLLRKGWWSTAEGINKARNIYNAQQKLKNALVGCSEERLLGPESGLSPKKKHSRGKSRHAEISFPANRDPCNQVEFGESSQSSGQPKYTVGSYLSPEDYGSDDGSEEHCMFGFTNREVDELFQHGIKPWDDEAQDFLEALHDAYRKIDTLKD